MSDSGEVPDPFEEVREDAAPAAPLFLSAAVVERLDVEAGWQPSPDQEEALFLLCDALEQSGVVSIFSGSAGTGKTTVCRALLRRLHPASWDILLLAPTWRAANRLAAVTGREAQSIHSAIYGKPLTERQCPCGEWSAGLMEPVPTEVEVEEVRVKLPRYLCPTCKTPHADATRFPERLEFALREEEGGGGEVPAKPYRLVLVDEAGMVSGQVREDLEKAFRDEQTRVLYVGDPCQLDPVEDVGDVVDLTHPTASLTTVHRQAGDSPILRLAETLKVFPIPSSVEWPFPRRVPGIAIRARVPLDEPARWAAGLRCRGASVALIALSNKTRASLNALVREYTGAAAWSRSTGQPVLPGDRLLARVNSGEVRNGELWCVAAWERVPPDGGMLNPRGRFPRKKPNYEHDRILEGGVGVFRVSLAMVGSEGRRVEGVVVAPLDASGQPLLESGLIRAGEDASKARDRMRRIAAAWASEYQHGVEEYQGEFERAVGEAQDRVIASARFRAAAAVNDRKGMLQELRRLWRGGGTEAKERSVAVATSVERGESVDVEGVIEGLKNVRDVALECANVQAYCERVYGALDYDRVIVVDEGEALTCHACVHPDTLIETEGGLLPIRLAASTGVVATPDGSRAYTRVVVRPAEPLLRITVEGAYSLMVTRDHGMDTWNAKNEAYERVEARELQEGSWLRLRLGALVEPSRPSMPPGPVYADARSTACRLPSEVTPDFAEWLGMFVADGTLFKQGFRLLKRHRDVVEHFAELTTNLFGLPTEVRNADAEKYIDPVYVVEVISTYLATWLRHVGGLVPHGKAVPDCVLRADSSRHAAFLRGLAVDGSVHVKEGKLDHIEINQVSPGLVPTMRTLLLRLGIVTGHVQKAADNVTVYGHFAKLFAERVGLSTRFHQERAAGVPATLPAQYRVPIGYREAGALRDSGEFTRYDFNNSRHNGYLSRALCAKAPTLADRLQWHHARVVQIEETPPLPSMCLTVPDGHQFLQNGFSGWNCQGDQAEHVGVVFDGAFWGMWRNEREAGLKWAYTAITRAEKELALFSIARVT